MQELNFLTDWEEKDAKQRKDSAKIEAMVNVANTKPDKELQQKIKDQILNHTVDAASYAMYKNSDYNETPMIGGKMRQYPSGKTEFIPDKKEGRITLPTGSTIDFKGYTKPSLIIDDIENEEKQHGTPVYTAGKEQLVGFLVGENNILSEAKQVFGVEAMKYVVQSELQRLTMRKAFFEPEENRKSVDEIIEWDEVNRKIQELEKVLESEKKPFAFYLFNNKNS